MEDNKSKKKNVCVVLTPQDYDRLSILAENAQRTRAGYLRWLLHRHFREQGRPDALFNHCGSG